jgi:KDO2-lipid IV(A) lauroyltransferase
MARPPTPLRRLRWAVEYLAVLVLYGLLVVLPHRTRLALGRALGRFVYRIDGRHRAVAEENLARAWPEKDEAWRGQTARASFEHLGRLLVEVLVQRREKDRIPERLIVEGWEHVEAAARAGKGFFILSGHFGNWEWSALNHGLHGIPLWLVARPLDNPYLETFFAGLRKCTGNRVVYKKNAIREMVKGIKGGHGVAFMIDQDFPHDGAHFPLFFGRAAATTPALGTLAARLGAPIIPALIHPLDRVRYRAVYSPPLEAPQGLSTEETAEALSQAANAALERAVRACPGGWFWMHRRWRTRPPGEPHARRAVGGPS